MTTKTTTGAWGDELPDTVAPNTSPVRQLSAADQAVNEALAFDGLSEALACAWITCSDDYKRRGLVRMLKTFRPRVPVEDDGFRVVEGRRQPFRGRNGFRRENRGGRQQNRERTNDVPQRQSAQPPEGFKLLHNCESAECDNTDENHLELYWHIDTLPADVLPYCRYCAKEITFGGKHCQNKNNVNFQHLIADNTQSA